MLWQVLQFNQGFVTVSKPHLTWLLLEKISPNSLGSIIDKLQSVNVLDIYYGLICYGKNSRLFKAVIELIYGSQLSKLYGCDNFVD